MIRLISGERMVPFGIIDRNISIRFCAKWRNLFHASVSPLLRMRLVCVQDMDIDLGDPMIRSSTKWVVEAEKDLWLARNGYLNIYSRTHVSWESIQRKPELSAMVIGHRLFSEGHHPQFLFTLHRFWMWALSKVEDVAKCSDDEIRDLSRTFDGIGFSFDLWRQYNPPLKYDCYVGTNNSASVAITESPVAIIKSNSDLIAGDEAKTEATTQISERIAGQPTYLQQITAKDACSAIDEYIIFLSNRSKINSVLALPNKRKRKKFWPLLSDAKLMIRREGDIFVEFTVKNRINTEIISIDSDNRLITGIDLQGKSASFASLIDSYSIAMTIAQKGDTTSLFKALSIGLDNLLLPVSSVRRQNSNIELANIPGIAAKIVALDALRNAFGSFCRAVQREGNRQKLRSSDFSFAALKRLKIESLPEELRQLFSPSLENAQIFDVAWFIKKQSISLRSFLSSVATRYYFDIKRCMLCRNEIVHRGRDKTNEYFANIVLLLFRLIIEFRLSTSDILPKLSAIDCRIKTQDDVFGALMRLAVQDFDSIVAGRPVLGIDTGVLALTHAGWGTWAAGGLGAKIERRCASQSFMLHLNESISLDESELAKITFCPDLFF